MPGFDYQVSEKLGRQARPRGWFALPGSGQPSLASGENNLAPFYRTQVSLVRSLGPDVRPYMMFCRLN